jgi:sugar/nucleoside kinase (ribokinase family)
MRQFDILVAGEINPDLILSFPDSSVRFGQVETLVDAAALTIGSSSAIFACGAARLGLRVAFIGVVGEDLFADFMLKELQAHGLDCSHVISDPAQQTGFSVILNRSSDRAILTYAGAMSALRAEQVTDDLLSRSRHLHIASYFLQTALQPGLPDLLRRARALGLTVSLDPNWDPSETWHGIDDLIPMVDVFLPNDQEALSITHTANIHTALERIGQSCRVVALKRGKNGASVYSAGQIDSAPSLPVTFVDAVGAGDSFDAGFIYGFLQDWDLQRSLRLGTACGSLSTRQAGGTAAQPTLKEALSFF